MKHEFWKRWMAITLALLLLSSTLLAQKPDATRPSAKPAPRGAAEEENSPAGPTKEEPPRGGPHEGIKVHGHWTIVIKNADGSVASRHEFENGLQLNGAYSLATLLTQPQSSLVWSLGLIENGSSVYFPTQTVQQVNGTVVLTGSSQISYAYLGATSVQIGGVETVLKLPSTGTLAFSQRNLTATTQPPPINVQDLQTVDVTVTISFS